MSKIKILIYLLIAFNFSFCASLPNSTVTLTNEIVKEANNMHALNIVLVNKLFEERIERVNLFIENKYTPTLIKKYEKLLPNSLDYKKELPNIIKSIVPVINRKKDSILLVLKKENIKIVSQLNTGFNDYTTATTSLQNLIQSVVKVKMIEHDALMSIEKLTGTTQDVNQITSSVETFLYKTNNDLSKLLMVKEELSKAK